MDEMDNRQLPEEIEPSAAEQSPAASGILSPDKLSPDKLPPDKLPPDKLPPAEPSPAEPVTTASTAESAAMPEESAESAAFTSESAAAGTESEAPALLELNNVVKNYGSKKVLNNLSFTVGHGGIIGLLGPNGSGKTTIIKLINGLLVPNSGEILINGERPSPNTAAIVSYLPERNYLPLGDRVCDLVDYFADFYADFDRVKAHEMLGRLKINDRERMRSLSKGTREKVQLILVMSRAAQLYVLDEPIGGVDPAARDYILDTILSNYSEGGSILISTHLISDIERTLDDVIFISEGKAALCASVDSIREKHGKSVDELFREVYKC